MLRSSEGPKSTRVGNKFQLDHATLPTPHELQVGVAGSRGKRKAAHPQERGAGEGATLLFSGADLEESLRGLEEYQREGMTRVDSYLGHLRRRTKPKPGMLVWVATSTVTNALAGTSARPPVASAGSSSETKEGQSGDDPRGHPGGGRDRRLHSGKVTSILADGSVEILLVPSRREKFGSQPSRIVVPMDSVTHHIDPETALRDLALLRASSGKNLAPSPHRKVPLPSPVVPLWSHHDHVLFVQSYARWGKNFAEISKTCSRPLGDIVSHYFLHKHHLKAKTTGPRTPRGATSKGAPGELPSKDSTCRSCDGVCHASSAAVCTRKNCRSLTCVACLEASGDQTLDETLSNPAWRCGRCRRTYGGSEGGSAASRSGGRGGRAHAELVEQMQIWNRIKKDQQQRKSGGKGETGGIGGTSGAGVTGGAGSRGGKGSTGSKSSKGSKSKGGGKGKKKARARAGSTDDDESDSSTGRGGRGKGKRRRQAVSPSAYLNEEQGSTGAGKWQGHALFGAIGGMQQGLAPSPMRMNMGALPADHEPGSSLEPHFQVHAQFNDSMGLPSAPGRPSAPSSGSNRRKGGAGGRRGKRGAKPKGGMRGKRDENYEAMDDGGSYEARGGSGGSEGEGGSDGGASGRSDQDVGGDPHDHHEQDRATYITYIDDEEEEWDNIFAGLPEELQEFLRKVYFTEQFAQFFDVLQGMDTSPDPLQEVRKCQSILAQAYNNELLNDFNALFNQ